jgi:tetrapyrrole methylase family protein/MazG family protein
VRTARHPAVEALPEIPWKSFDPVYEEGGSFERVYRTIAEKILELARREAGVVYAVPGDPRMGEAVTDLVVEAAREADLPVRIVSGVSFLEPRCSCSGSTGFRRSSWRMRPSSRPFIILPSPLRPTP